MDISDEELFDATPSCSTSITNISLNSSEETNNLTLDSMQEKDFGNIATKNISIKLTRLSTKKKQTNSKTKKRHFWKFGQISKRKKVPFFEPSRSQQEFQKMKPATEVASVLSEDRDNEEMHNQSYEVEIEKSYEDDHETAQNKTESFISFTSEEEEKHAYANEVLGCARTLPYEFHRKDGKISNDKGTAMKGTASSSLLSSNDKNTEPNLYSNRSCLSDCSFSNTRKDERLIHSRLISTAKRMRNHLNKWKFKRKYSSDSESEELPLPRKRYRRILSNKSDEDAPVNDTEAIDNNQNESHLSFEKIDKKKTQINCTAQVFLTRLEEVEDEDVTKWRRSKTPSDIVVSEPEERQQLDRRKLLQTLEYQNNLILPKKDGFLETKDPVLATTSSCVEKCSTTKSKLNKLKKRYKLFKKPRVLMIKLETLQCSPKDGRYSTIEIDCLTKKYVTSIINSNFQYKSRGLKMYRHVRLRRKSMTDAEDTAEDRNTSVSRRQSTNEIFNPYVTEESSIKGTVLF